MPFLAKMSRVKMKEEERKKGKRDRNADVRVIAYNTASSIYIYIALQLIREIFDFFFFMQTCLSFFLSKS